MCEKADQIGWSKILNDAEARGERIRRESVDTITSTAVSATQETVGSSADDPARTQTQSDQLHGGVNRAVDVVEVKLIAERLTVELEEQVGGSTIHTEDKPKETTSHTIEAAEDAVYTATTGRAENVMQDMNKKIDRVTEPGFAKATEPVSLGAQPMPPATSTEIPIAHLPSLSQELDPLAIDTAMQRPLLMAEPTPTAASSVSSTAAYLKGKGSSVVDAVVQNPLPAALVGLGLSWFLMNMYQNRNRSVGNQMGQADHLADEHLSHTNTHTTLSDMSERLQENASSVVSQVQHQVSDIAGRTRDQVSNIARSVQRGVQRTGDQYQQSLQNNPLAVGAAALALGSAVGLALPSTRTENKLMGKAHENLMRKVDEATHGTMQKMKEVAGEAGRAARKEAEFQGLTV